MNTDTLLSLCIIALVMFLSAKLLLPLLRVILAIVLAVLRIAFAIVCVPLAVLGALGVLSALRRN